MTHAITQCRYSLSLHTGKKDKIHENIDFQGKFNITSVKFKLQITWLNKAMKQLCCEFFPCCVSYLSVCNE